MRHLVYNKGTGQIIMVVMCSERNARNQETAELGVLVDTPCPAEPHRWKVAAGKMEAHTGNWPGRGAAGGGGNGT